MYNHQIYPLRNVELDPALAAKLWPFTNAYRPHDGIETWRELRTVYNPIEKDSALEELNDYYFEQKGYYPEEHPELQESLYTE